MLWIFLSSSLWRVDKKEVVFLTENWFTLQCQVVHPELQRAMKAITQTGDLPGLLGSSIKWLFSSRGCLSADLAFHSSLDFIRSSQTDLANSSWNMLFNFKGEHEYAQAKKGRTVWQSRNSEILYDSHIETPHFSQDCKTLCVWAHVETLLHQIGWERR